MARGCYDTMQDVLGAVKAVPGLAHVRPCEVLSEIYRDSWSRAHQTDGAITKAIDRNPPMYGRSKACTIYVSPNGNGSLPHRVKGWRPETNYNGALMICVLAARYRVKCAICKRLHSDAHIYEKRNAYRDYDDTRLLFSSVAPVCSDCARRRLEFDDPKQELGAITLITNQVNAVLKAQKKREVTKKEWSDLFHRLTNSPWV